VIRNPDGGAEKRCEWQFAETVVQCLNTSHETRDQRCTPAVFAHPGDAERIFFVLHRVVSRIERVHLTRSGIVIDHGHDTGVADRGAREESDLRQRGRERRIGGIAPVLEHFQPRVNGERVRRPGDHPFRAHSARVRTAEFVLHGEISIQILFRPLLGENLGRDVLLREKRKQRNDDNHTL
jgi:hypothetical protein